MATAPDAQQVRAMSEGQLFKKVAELLKGCGWHYFHISAKAYKHDSVRSGFPDLIAVRNGHIIVAELKREKGTLSDDQHEWLNDFGLHVGEVYRGHPIRGERTTVCVWRPSNLLSGEIAEILAGGQA